MFRLGVCVCFILSVAIAPPRFMPANQESAEILPGQIIDRVICRNKPDQSYALYLPSNYTRSRKWPILYAFDPGARGKLPVEHFKEAAERFGWILIGSNNSRNGAWQSSFDSWNAITADTHERLAIDDRRIYVAGFSGGARVAVTFAVQCRDCVAGVIASGAGFPPNIQPASTMHFALFGTTGTDDFNFPELKLLEDKLTRAGITHQIQVFAGRHEWPPSSVALGAVAWMELRAMKTGARNRDPAFIDTLWNEQLKEARALEVANKLYEAFQSYQELSTSFASFRDVAEVETKVSQLRENRDVQNANRDEQQEIRKQRDMEAEIAGLVSAVERQALLEVPDTGDTANRMSEESTHPDTRLRQIFSDLQRRAEAAQDSSARRVARRVLEGEFIGFFERASDLLQTQKRYTEAARVFTLATEVDPKRAGAFYYLAWAYIAAGDKKKSLQALKTAIEKGFSDRTALNDNRAFDILRDDPQFKQLVDSMKVR